MKRFVIALALTCVLSGTTLAGDIPSTDVVPPEEPSSAAVTILLTIITTVV